MKVLSAILILSVFAQSYAGFSSAEKNQCVEVHNKLRALHQNTGALVWDEGIARKAQAYAEVLANLGYMKHDTDAEGNIKDGHGENLYWSNNVVKAPCAKAVLSWYNEINDYSYRTAKSKNGKAVGHFTQVIWKDTTRVGVGIATRQNGDNIDSYIVAKYDPKGNFHMRGQRYSDYSKNVNPRNSGAVTPSLYDFIPCADSAGTEKCNLLERSGYGCTTRADIMKDNCAKKCGVCKGKGTTSTGTTSTGTTSTGTTSTGTTSTGTTSTGKTCNDKVTNCPGLAKQHGCNGSFKNFFTKNCAKTCGVCKATCIDQRGTTQCKNWIQIQRYRCGGVNKTFFTINCAKTCNYC